MTAVTDQTVVPFELRGAAWEVMRAKDSEILVSGPAGTGKSVAALLKIHLACMDNPGVRALVVRKTLISLTSSTLVLFKKKVAAEAIAMRYLHYFGGSGAEPASFRYKNGSVIVVGGLDRPSRLLSTEYDLALVDEAIETDSEDIDTIVTRLRNGVLPYQQLILLTNPGAPTHHLKQRAESGRCRILYSAHKDNPRMHDGTGWTEYGRDYLENKLGTLTGVRRQRFLLGQWCSAEGLVYDTFDPAVHLCKPIAMPPREWTRYLAVDFGFRNPMCVQWWAVDPDDHARMYREIYRTGQLVEDVARQVLAIVKKGDGHNPDVWPPRAIICDHDAEDRATLERHIGFSTTAATKNVSEGIQAVQSRLKVRGDGKPGLYICRDALVEPDPVLKAAHKPLCTADEILEYIWDPSVRGANGTAKEAPLKENDHGMDDMRYLVAAIDLTGRPRYRSFSPR